MDKQAPPRVLLVIIAVLLGVIVALVAGILASASGATITAAITSGGIAFAGTVTLTLLIMNALRAL
ncbi:hypothetical protein [Amycolatopsis sp. NPDC054798]